MIFFTLLVHARTLEMLLYVAMIHSVIGISFHVGDHVRVINTGDSNDSNAFLSGTVINVFQERLWTQTHQFCEIQMRDGRIFREHSESLHPFSIRIKKKRWFKTELSNPETAFTEPFSIGSVVMIKHNFNYDKDEIVKVL